MSPRSRLDWALDALERGYSVSPLLPGSNLPRAGSGGFKDATRDTAQVVAWWTENPDYNVAITPGAGRVVVDLDCKAGKDGLAAWCERTGMDVLDVLTTTYRVETPSGGSHCYFETPEDFPQNNDAFRDGRGVDVRGVTGYVVGPGSVRDGREYRVVVDLPPAPLPEGALRALVAARDDRSRRRAARSTEPLFEQDLPASVEAAEEWLRTWPPAVGDVGLRGSEFTFRTACELKERFCLSEETVLRLMLQEWNDRCLPPWDEDGMAARVRSAFKNSDSAPGSKARGTRFDLEHPPVGGASGNRWDRAMLTGEEVFPTCFASTIIRQWLPDRMIVIALGKRGDGKTTAMLDVALCLAHDMQWQDKPTKEGWCAAYFAGENGHGAREMVKAWCLARGRGCPDPGRFALFENVPDLTSAADIEAAVDSLRRKFPGRQIIIFVDTWQRAIERAGDRDAAAVVTCATNLERMARELGGPAVVACHPPKNNPDTVSGPMELENMSSALWVIAPDAAGKKMRVDRIRDDPADEYLYFGIDLVQVADDDGFGRPRRSAVLRATGGSRDDLRARDRAVAVAVAELMTRDGGARCSHLSVCRKLTALSKAMNASDMETDMRSVATGLTDAGVTNVGVLLANQGAGLRALARRNPGGVDLLRRGTTLRFEESGPENHRMLHYVVAGGGTAPPDEGGMEIVG